MILSRTLTGSLRQPDFWRTRILPALVGAMALGMSFFKGAMVKGLRKALPYVQPVGAWLMVLAGAYIVFYWLTIGGLL